MLIPTPVMAAVAVVVLILAYQKGVHGILIGSLLGGAFPGRLYVSLPVDAAP